MSSLVRYPVPQAPTVRWPQSRIIAPPQVPGGSTIAVFQSSWATTTTPKTVVVPGCLIGDHLLVLGGGDMSTGNTVASVTTTTSAGPGTTGSWTEPAEVLTGTTDDWLTSAIATVTGDGDITVQMARTVGTGAPGEWGFWVLRARDSAGFGAPVTQLTSGSGQVVSVTTTADSVVAYLSVDWDAASVGTFTPGGAVEVERAAIGGVYTVHAAYWPSQAAGTRDYGHTGGGGTKYRIVAVEVLGPSSGVSGAGNIAQRSSTASAATKSVAGAGTAQARTTSTVTASKAATGAAITMGRVNTAAVGRKLSASLAGPAQRMSTSTIAAKQAAGTATSVTHVITRAGFTSPGPSGATSVPQHAVTGAVGLKRVATPASASTRPSVVASGRKQVSAGALAVQHITTRATFTPAGPVGTTAIVQRSIVVAVGAKRIVALTGAVTHTYTMTGGRKQAMVTGPVTGHSVTATTGAKLTAGGTSVAQRTVTVASMFVVSPYVPALVGVDANGSVGGVDASGSVGGVGANGSVGGVDADATVAGNLG